MAVTGNGFSAAQKYIALLLSTLALLAILAGTVYTWGDMQHVVRRNTERIVEVESSTEDLSAQLDSMERKLDRLLIVRGLDPDESQ